MQPADPSLPPTRPDTTIFDVNLTGTIYTTKLAIHYFRRQSLEPGRDRCLILIGSIAGYLDLPGSATYSMSKFGVRALMRSLRRNAWVDSIRVNLVSPRYVLMYRPCCSCMLFMYAVHVLYMDMWLSYANHPPSCHNFELF